MKMFQESHNGIEIFNITGNLDSNTSQEFEKSINAVLENGTRQIIFNLENLEYISSAGIRSMLKMAQDFKQLKGLVVLCSLQNYVKEVFHIAGFDAYLNIEADLQSAMARF